MPISLPTLDDRTYEELLAEARGRIPSLTPEWTNFNESDPGMVLAELFAWLTEMLLYRVDQVTEANVEAFLALLNDPGWSRAPEQDLETAVHETVTSLRQRYRAVTAMDYERLVLDEFGARVARVRCVPGGDPAAGPEMAVPGRVTLVVLPEEEQDKAFADLRQKIADFLEPRRLLTVQHRIVEPATLDVWFHVHFILREDVRARDGLAEVRRALEAHFDSLRGGPSGEGWPFGGHVLRGDVYALLDRLGAVDYVRSLNVETLIAHADRRIYTAGQTTGLRLRPHELVSLDWTQMVLVAEDVDGRTQRWSAEEET